MRKKIAVLLLAMTMLASSAHALGIIDSLIYDKVNLNGQRVLVNRITGRVDKILENGVYINVSTQRGWGGIPSAQEVLQAQYDRMVK